MVIQLLKVIYTIMVFLSLSPLSELHGDRTPYRSSLGSTGLGARSSTLGRELLAPGQHKCMCTTYCRYLVGKELICFPGGLPLHFSPCPILIYPTNVYIIPWKYVIPYQYSLFCRWIWRGTAWALSHHLVVTKPPQFSYTVKAE